MSNPGLESMVLQETWFLLPYRGQSNLSHVYTDLEETARKGGAYTRKSRTIAGVSCGVRSYTSEACREA